MRRQRGLSLIELIVFIVIVSVGLVGILSVLNLTASKSADPIVHKQALATAEAMMEEILSKDFSNGTVDPAGCTAATTPRCQSNSVTDRPNYNDVGDYDGWDQNGVYRADGSVVSGLAGYRVTVSVAATTDLSPAVAKKVTVTVTAGGNAISLVGYRANYE